MIHFIGGESPTTTLPPHTPTIGVTYFHSPSSPLSPDKLVAHIAKHKVSSVRIVNADPTVIQAFSKSDISLLLSIPNSQIRSFAVNRSKAADWVFTHVLPFHPRAHISAISVGTNVLGADIMHVLPAMKNIRAVLNESHLYVSVSTTFSFFPILTTPFPPSSCQFAQPMGVLGDILSFLEESNSLFLMHIQPYPLYLSERRITVGFAIFQESNFSYLTDYKTGIKYHNLFDVMFYALEHALAVAGKNLRIVVTGTGWPNSPGEDPGEDLDANFWYAKLFLDGLVRKLTHGMGTPSKIEGVYISELFDDQSSTAPRWGIWYPNLTEKFNVDFSGSISRLRKNDCFVILSVLVSCWLSSVYSDWLVNL